MTRTLRGGTFAALLLTLLPLVAGGQEAVIISGRVTADAAPLQGASVRIAELDLGTVTSAAGRYSIIVPSARVRGQTVTLTVRHARHAPQSVYVALVGGAIERDFELARAASQSRVPLASTGPRAPSLRVDSSAFVEVSGPVDLPAALAGRLAGVEVRTASTFQGSSAIEIRGPHTIFGLTQPLYVVDGIIIGNANVTDIRQRQGLGGFDRGSGIGDIDLFDVESVEVLRGPAAALAYGGTAANGVVRITTRDASALHGFVVSARQQLSTESPLRLPAYQDAFGQGRAGEFSFFDGRGGGVNDDVAENWGPALLGQPIPQASLTEAGRAEVRFWTARPGNVDDWFRRGHTSTTNVAALGGDGTSHIRLSFGNRTGPGLIPEASGSRQSFGLTAGTRALPRTRVDASARFVRAVVHDRAGTGIDPSNPVFAFARMGRQVDVAALRTHLRDANGDQVSWNYTGYDNPWFAALENSNEDRRTHVLAGLNGTTSLARWLTATGRVGVDRATESRTLDVASGWMGGHAFAGGVGDFSTGGWQDERVRSNTASGELALEATIPSAGPAITLAAGVGRRASSLRTTVDASDALVGGTVIDEEREASGSTNYAFGEARLGLGDIASVVAALRHESSTLEDGTHGQAYPAVLATVDLARLAPGLRTSAHLEAVTLRAGWAVSGNTLTPMLLQQLDMLPLAAGSVSLDATPERTRATEIGLGALVFGGRVALDVAWYDETSERLVARVADTLARIGSISNSGLEAQVGIVAARGARFEWRVDANVAHNANRVDEIEGPADRVALGTTFEGTGLFAVRGEPLHVIVGARPLRDAAGNLVLRDGLPAADLAERDAILGHTAPDWFGGVGTSMRFRGIELAVLFDIRRGGQLFSATNQVGITTGTYAETAVRPDTGLLVIGTDATTGGPNTTHVSAEAYYRALGAFGEPWVYDASFTRLREARVSFTAPLHRVPGLRAQSVRLSVIGRNLALWTNVPHVDPETLLSTAFLRGFEMGQHPAVRSVGVQLSVSP